MCMLCPTLKVRLVVLLCLGLSFFPAMVSAQLRLGPKLGFQAGKSVFADKAYREKYSSGFRAGFNIGAVVNYKVNNLYSLHTELYYSQKGKVSANKVSVVDDVRNKATYHFIDLPVLLRLSTKRNYRKYKVEYYANIGPSLNYWLGGNGTVYSDELKEFLDTGSYDYSLRFKENSENGRSVYIPAANRFQMSLDFGGGVIFDLGTGQLIMVDLRNSVGIGKTFMGEDNNITYGLSNYKDNFEAVNHVYAISVAYLLEVDLQALVQKGRTRR